MRSLPYLVPEQDDSLNSGIVLLTIKNLGKTSRGRLLMNNERLLIFMYLIKNPLVMAKVLNQLGRSSPTLGEQDTHSVSSLAVNLDPLFDADWIKRLLQYIASVGLLAVQYRKAEGFLYGLTEAGDKIAEKLTGNHYDKVREYISALDTVKAESTANLNSALNSIFKR
jgi:hypothetical protein